MFVMFHQLSILCHCYTLNSQIRLQRKKEVKPHSADFPTHKQSHATGRRTACGFPPNLRHHQRIINGAFSVLFFFFENGAKSVQHLSTRQEEKNEHSLRHSVIIVIIMNYAFLCEPSSKLQPSSTCSSSI